ncbi:hypothetical protein IV203_026341 [Nitzschia inconspicua]|uniref:Uncharacterized protein n=1 Tax=Nitzschia inconspicua TaxID=303405 RepID=A0A9K3PXG5_9STRA|nr:hypothetical protein IV203_026341 [Nitzschia inconspicua]
MRIPTSSSSSSSLPASSRRPHKRTAPLVRRRPVMSVLVYGLTIASLFTLVHAANNYNNYYNNNGNNNYANANNNNYYYNQNYNNNNDNNNNNNNNNYQYNYQQGDDAAGAQQNDDNNNNKNGDDQYQYYAYNNGGNDDAAANANGDDAAAAQTDDNNNNNNGDDQAAAEEAQNNVDDTVSEFDSAWEDDMFHWDANLGFDGVSIMPVSCVNYNNGHMIKFQMFETENAYQCHFAEIGTFVVSIAHYMRAYFNYQALEQGRDFSLPHAAGYLNCVMLQQDEEGTSTPLYAKVGCMERETFTSTKLQLHVYTDSQCSVPYDDGQTARYHATRGYLLTNAREETFLFSTKVNFRPSFYTCQSCSVEEISETFNKQYGTWYDDDYISQNGQKQQKQQEQENDNNNNDNNNNNENQDDNVQNGNDDQAANNGMDDYYHDDGKVDDTYMSANDDIYRYQNNKKNQYYYYNGNRVLLRSGEEDDIRFVSAAPGELEKFETEFWRDIERQQKQRELYDNNYSVDDWNMCRQVYKYGLYCDEQCRSLDAFRTDRWSGADIILLSIMCTFMAAMMLLIVAKRLKVSQRQRQSYQNYENETVIPSSSMPGLPPVAMLAIFVSIMIIIIVLAELKFVNETLVFAVVTCVLLFIYMLKLTLFASRKPVLLAGPKHDMFDNALDERLFT